MISSLVFLTTWAGWRRHQLQLLVHVVIQSVVTCALPHQGNLLLSGQQVVVILHALDTDDDALPAVADAVSG